ncbi:MAG TPA: DUF4258 domain-containing protein [bacterium]|nr:DUF4258 domain-containing protein [bacterium]
MTNARKRESAEVTVRLQQQAFTDSIRVTVHGHQEMVAEEIAYQDVREALLTCEVIEDYPDHQRGPCCLVCGRTSSGRFLHVVCTTTLKVIVIITVYEPKLPKWPTPFERGGRHEM